MSDACAENETWLHEVTTSLGRARVGCQQCSLNNVCDTLTAQNPGSDLVQSGRIGTGHMLFHAGDPFNGVYAVTAGAIKTFARLGKDVEQVVDFYFPGDAVGLEAIDQAVYPYSAQALCETLVCRLDIDQSGRLDGTQHKDVKEELIRALGEQLRHEQSLSILLRNQTADQRVATFLLSLAGPSLWTHARSVDLHLPMSRKDTANYLGIAVETLSRLIKRLQVDGVIKSSGRHISLLDIERLRQRALPTGAPPQTQSDTVPN